MLWKILTRTCSSVFFFGLFPVHQFPEVFWFDRILISEALFTFPVKRFMQELIHSMISSRFHVKDRSLLFSKKL